MKKQPRPSNQSIYETSNRTGKRSRGASLARRMSMGVAAGLAGLAIGAVVVGFGLFAGPKGTAAERSGSGPAVVELFTSQGCYSCPPAEKFRHGSYKDPFSDEKNTYRQQLYNRTELEGQRGVFTPQTVINGSYATVGSRGSTIRKGIKVLDRPFVDLAVVHDPEPQYRAALQPANPEQRFGCTGFS